ncbi:MAG: hypothetical protein Alpg2KO_29750 [Alphaproteobacteria bacterium]
MTARDGKSSGGNGSRIGGDMDGMNQWLRSVQLADRRTSIRMESSLWLAFDDILKRERLIAPDVLIVLDGKRGKNSLTAALRVFITAYFHALVIEQDALLNLQPILEESRKRHSALKEEQASYLSDSSDQ